MTEILRIKQKKKKKKCGRVGPKNKLTRPVDRKQNYF